MSKRSGECTACGALYELPAELAVPFVKCRLCSGAVKVGEVVETPPPPAPVAATEEAPMEELDLESDDAGDVPAPTVSEFASAVAHETLDEAFDAVDAVEDAIEEAGEELVESAETAVPSSLGFAPHRDFERPDAEAEAAAAAKPEPAAAPERESAFVADLEDFELEDLEPEDVAAAEERSTPPPAPAVPARPGAPSKKAEDWSPAALERGDDEPVETLDPVPARPRSGGSTLERLKAQRAAERSDSDDDTASKKSGTLARLKAERAAQREREESAEAPRAMSTLERLKAERAAQHGSGTATVERESATSGSSTLERLKRERAAARAQETVAVAAAPAPIVTKTGGSVADRARGGRPKHRKGDPVPHHHRPDREGQKRKQAMMALWSLLALIVVGAAGAYVYFETDLFAEETPPPTDTTVDVQLPTPSPVQMYDPFGGLGTTEPSPSGEAPAEGAGATDGAEGGATDGVDGGAAEDPDAGGPDDGGEE
ncbi:MAG: hypothetical protein R3F34_00185 [Planctomycetota bacterium]